MTEINASAVNSVEKKEVTVKWSKMTDGIGLVFAGVISMLEALDASTAKDIMNCISQSDAKKEEGEADDAKDTGAGDVDVDAGTDTDPVADQAATVEAEQPVQKEEPKVEASPVPSITQDDITKIIVQKLKKDRSNNEKIGAILKTYGVAKVSELPAEKYEAFLTDLSQL